VEALQGTAWASAHAPLFLLFQAHPRQAFWQWMAKHKKVYANDLKVRPCPEPALPVDAPRGLAHGCLRSFVQVVEDRFRVWLDNLQFIEDYNTKHTSHWVSLE
jgi:hypothetical protein